MGWKAKKKLKKINPTDKSIKLIKIPKQKGIKISSIYVQNWAEEEYPSGRTLFGINDFYKGIKEEAEKQMQIPTNYAALYDIKVDPAGGYWLLRTFYRQDGQIWTYKKGDISIQVNLPAKRKLFSIGKKYIVMKFKDEDGIEYLELYPKHQFISQ